MKQNRILLYSAVPFMALCFFFLSAGPADAQGLVEYISPEISGTLGDDGWYVSDVALAWVNPPPGATDIIGCQGSLINSDTASVVEICSYLFNGTTYIGIEEIKRDTTPPEPDCNVKPFDTIQMSEGDTLALDCSGSVDNLSSVQVSFDTNEDGVYGDAPVFDAIDESLTPCFIGFLLADEAGNVTEFTVLVEVANAPPLVEIVQVDNQTTAIGGQVDVYVNVEDPGVNDELTVFIDWGDGDTLTGHVTPCFIHVYTRPGIYSVSIIITDDAGAASAAASAQIMVEDPLQTIDFIEDEVITAVGAGIYNHGQENSLRAKLDASRSSIERQAFEAAAGQLRAFAYQGFAITDPAAVLTPCFDLALQIADALDGWVPEPT